MTTMSSCCLHCSCPDLTSTTVLIPCVGGLVTSFLAHMISCSIPALGLEQCAHRH